MILLQSTNITRNSFSQWEICVIIHDFSTHFLANQLTRKLHGRKQILTEIMETFLFFLYESITILSFLIDSIKNMMIATKPFSVEIFSEKILVFLIVK